MKPALIALLSSAAWLLHPTEARPEVLVVPSEDTGIIALLIHRNHNTPGAPNVVPFSVEVEGYGPIVGRVDNTRNILCDPPCPDVLTIDGMPDGVAVEHWQVTTPEKGVSTIRILEAVGF